MVGFSAAGDFLNRGKAEFSNMQNDRPVQTTEARRKGRIIPRDEVMKKFEEIYQNHRAVFDYLKEH